MSLSDDLRRIKRTVTGELPAASPLRQSLCNDLDAAIGSAERLENDATDPTGFDIAMGHRRRAGEADYLVHCNHPDCLKGRPCRGGRGRAVRRRECGCEAARTMPDPYEVLDDGGAL